MSNKEIPYVIYCRKSTDDNDSQTQSIPKQIEACVQYADENGYTIMDRPDDYSMFESDLDVAKEEKDKVSKSIYRKHRNKFIIKERHTAHKPGRPKWKNLIKRVKRGKIKGVIAYDPDRLSRNMLEAGELLDLLDRGSVELAFKSFDFTNNSNGKMMLTMLFGFAKHYSDHRSDHTHAGNAESLKRGLALGRSKYGYMINSEGMFEPHSDYFPLMQKAFTEKIYHKKTDKEIAKWLKNNGFKIWKKVSSKNPLSSKRDYIEADISANALNRIWKDTFYYGVFNYGKSEPSDQREVNPYFIPMITQQEFLQLQDQLRKTSASYKKLQVDPDLEKCFPFTSGLVKDQRGNYMTPNLPNRNTRHIPNLKKLQRKKVNAELCDVVKISQIRYSASKKGPDGKRLFNVEVNADEINKRVSKMLEKFIQREDLYQVYKTAALKKQNEDNAIYKQQKASWAGVISKKKERLEEFIFNYSISSTEHNEKTKQVFEKRVALLEKEISVLENDLANLEIMKRNYLKEAVIFYDLMNNIGKKRDKATNVQKARIASIIFSNIEVTDEKAIRISLKEIFMPYVLRNLSPPRFERRSTP